jgi:hypothetical protein
MSKYKPVKATPEEQEQGKSIYLAIRHIVHLADIMGVAPNVIMSALVQVTVSAQLDLGAVEPENMLIESIKMAMKIRAEGAGTDGNA